MAKIGRRQRWGEATRPVSARYPASHLHVYERLAAERGLSLSEFLVLTCAEHCNLTFPSLHEQEGQLQLGA